MTRRGEWPIKMASFEAQKAATRNGNKPDHTVETLGFWTGKIEEEAQELIHALWIGDAVRIQEELGDLVWSGAAGAEVAGAFGKFPVSWDGRANW